MKSNNILQIKSFAFAIRIVNVYKYLISEKKEYVLSKQLLKCGTSIGANVEEALGGQSEADFYAKITIAYKETRETGYWLRLMYETDYLKKEEFESLILDCDELARIIGKIQITIKNR